MKSRKHNGVCRGFALSLMAALGVAFGAGSAGASNAFSGVVEQVDTAHMKLVVKSDAGKTIGLEVSKSELLKDIGAGDRITVELDDKEKATKIMKNIPIPELREPGSEPPPAAEKGAVPPGSR